MCVYPCARLRNSDLKCLLLESKPEQRVLCCFACVFCVGVFAEFQGIARLFTWLARNRDSTLLTSVSTRQALRCCLIDGKRRGIPGIGRHTSLPPLWYGTIGRSIQFLSSPFPARRTGESEQYHTGWLLAIRGTTRGTVQKELVAVLE